MKKSHTRATRRDRRKAKQSDFAREGTSNPKKKGHHLYEKPAALSVEATVARRSSCTDETGGHEFVADVALGVRVCRLCGQHADMRKEDLAKPRGRGLSIPRAIRDRVAQKEKPEAPAPRKKSETTFSMPPECRDAHDYRNVPDLGIWQCRKCGAPRKD